MKVSRPSLFAIAGACLYAVFSITTLIWLRLDRAPPNWDDAWYLSNSLAVYDALTSGGIAGYLAKLNSVFGFKAPLIAALPAPFYLLFGRRWHAAFLVNLVCMLVLFWSTYRIAWRLWNKRAALFTIAIVGSMPLLYGLSRWYLVEYALAALVSLCVCLIIESEDFERRGIVLSLGVVFGMGLLLKTTFAVYVAPVFFYSWITSRNRVRTLVLTAAPCFLLAMPWYAGHLRPTLRHALDSGFGQLASVYGAGPIFSANTISTYGLRVMASGISVYYTVLTILLVLWTASRRAGRLGLQEGMKRPSRILFFWALPFLVFLFGENKDLRFIAPILPAAALLVAYLLDASVPRTRAGALLSAVLFGIPIVQMFAVSFGFPYQTSNLIYARRFTRSSWPQDEMLRMVAANSILHPGEKQMLLIGADRAGLNANNIELTVMALQLPFTVETTAHEGNFDTLRERLGNAAFFVYIEGGEGESAFFNPHIRKLVELVTHDARFSELPFSRRLPDAGVARIFRATP